MDQSKRDQTTWTHPYVHLGKNTKGTREGGKDGGREGEKEESLTLKVGVLPWTVFFRGIGLP